MGSPVRGARGVGASLHGTAARRHGLQEGAHVVVLAEDLLVHQPVAGDVLVAGLDVDVVEVVDVLLDEEGGGVGAGVLVEDDDVLEVHVGHVEAAVVVDLAVEGEAEGAVVDDGRESVAGVDVLDGGLVVDLLGVVVVGVVVLVGAAGGDHDEEGVGDAGLLAHGEDEAVGEAALLVDGAEDGVAALGALQEGLVGDAVADGGGELAGVALDQVVAVLHCKWRRNALLGCAPQCHTIHR